MLPMHAYAIVLGSNSGTATLQEREINAYKNISCNALHCLPFRANFSIGESERERERERERGRESERAEEREFEKSRQGE